MNEIIEYSQQVFDEIKNFGRNGREFWFARELQEVLGYTQWRNFETVIKKAQRACLESDVDVTQHFVGLTKVVEIGKGAKREVHDMALSRYACYLIVQNGDSSKKIVALAQTYFAIMTRTQELSQESYDELEDKSRLAIRKELIEHNKSLAQAAKGAGVFTGIDFAEFHNSGYRGLYDGETKKDIQRRKGLGEKDDILDHMGSTELAANFFRVTQADDKIRREGIKGKDNANKAHFQVGQKVRQTIHEIGGEMPEKLPTPSRSIKQIEKTKKALIPAEICED